MSYTFLVIIAVAGAVLVDVALARTVLIRRKAFWTAYGIVLFFQLIVNGVLTGVPVVRYAPAAITGVRLVYAPIEDIGFGFALVLLTLTSWVALGRHDAHAARDAAHGAATPAPRRSRAPRRRPGA